MKNYIQPGDNLTLVAPTGGVVAGNPIVIGQIAGIAKDSALEGNPVVAEMVGVYELPADAGVAVGDAVEWNGTAVVDLASGTRLGVCVALATGVAWIRLG